jgi:hypothetical protein
VTWKPWRITTWWVKASFVAIGVLVGWPIEALLLLAGSSGEVALAAALASSLPFLVVGARIFRVPGESTAPRPWWQFTGRYRLSFGVAVLSAVVLVMYLVTAPVSQFSVAEDAISFAAWLLLGALYLNSGIRLRRIAHSPNE